VDINLQVGSGGGGGEYRLHAAESDLTVAGEIEIGVQNDGRFEWFAGDIATAALTVGANGTLAMGFDFNLPNLAGGALTQYQQQNSTVTLDPGTVEVTHGATCTHNSTGTVSMGSLVIGSADGAGTLEITQAGSPNIELSDSLTFASNSTFSAVSASETSIRLGGGRTGAFENENTSGSALAGLGNLTLGCLFVDEGPNKGNVLNFRLSGQRPGEELTSDDFCESNFVMNKLVVGRPSTGPEDDDYGIQVAFLDEEENKALYVNTLEIQAGARFKCVDLVLEQEVYYDKPAPKRLYMGDADLNGRVDGLDYNTWSSHYNETGSTWAHGDFNGDRVVDGLDYNIWAANYGSGWGDKGGGGPSKELVDLVQACPDGDLDSDGDIDEDDVFMLMWLEELDAQP